MNTISRGLVLLLFIILASVLTPTDFGVYGIAILVIAAASEFTTIGLSEALIHQRNDDVDEFLDTAWVLEVIRGVFVGAIVYLSAPLIAGFFNEPNAVDVVRLMAITPIIFGLRNPAIVYFKKSLEFHLEFLYIVSGAVIQFTVGLTLAYLWGTVWALAFAYVAVELVRTPISYLAHGYRPSFRFDRALAAEMLDYGKWMTGSSILYFLWEKGDDVIVGWLLATAALGWYQFAYRISNAPSTEISGVISNVMFPTFSKLQEDPAALREAFFRTIQVTSIISFPLAFGIIAVAPSFVRGFLGEAWIPMIPVLQILAIFGLLRTITTPMGALFRGIGRPDYATKVQAVRVVCVAILIIPATMYYGIVGAASVVVGVFLFPVFPIESYLTLKILKSSYRRFAAELAFPLFASFVMLLVTLGVAEVLPVTSESLTFVVLVLVGAVTYAVLFALLTTQFGWDANRNIKWMIKNAAG